MSDLYVEQAALVRRALRRSGVATADLDDLIQDVFLVIHRKRAALANVERIDLWLKMVCRRVASGHRNLARHRYEILSDEVCEPLSDASSFETSEFERRHDSERLLQALRALDTEARDLLALHAFAELPLVDVAKLMGRDRKTLRKKHEATMRRLLRAFGERARPEP